MNHDCFWCFDFNQECWAFRLFICICVHFKGKPNLTSLSENPAKTRKLSLKFHTIQMSCLESTIPLMNFSCDLVYLLPQKMVQVPCQFSLQTDIQTLKNGLKCVANQKIFNVWSKSHMCLGCLFWKQWDKCTSLILQSVIPNFGKHFWYVLNLITSCGKVITNFVKMSIWIISIVLNLLNFSKYFQL